MKELALSLQIKTLNRNTVQKKALAMMLVTRRATFNAAHRLFRPEWNDEENMSVFGKCSNPLWHGHNYELFVTVKGEVSEQTGFVMNLKDLNRVIQEYVVDRLDHKNLNLEVDFMKNRMISTENLAIAIWQQLQAPLREMGVELFRVKLFETENNFVEYYGT